MPPLTLDAITDKIETLKASIRAKNTAQLFTLFVLSNLWMVRKKPAIGSPA